MQRYAIISESGQAVDNVVLCDPASVSIIERIGKVVEILDGEACEPGMSFVWDANPRFIAQPSTPSDV